MFAPLLLWILSFSLIDIATADEPCKYTIKHEDYPEPSADTFRLYAVSSCPYCERVVIALCKKGIEFEAVNAANFQHAPDWFFSNNPEGFVPVLRHNGKLVNGSRVIIEYLDDVSSERSILPDEPKLRAKQRYDATRLESVCDAIREISFSNELTGNITLLAMELTKAEEMLQSSFYSGEEFGLPDIFLYPFIQRLHMIRQIIDDDFLEGVFGEYFPKLVNWFIRMRSLPEIQVVEETEGEMKDFMISKGNWNLPAPEVGMSIFNL